MRGLQPGEMCSLLVTPGVLCEPSQHRWLILAHGVKGSRSYGSLLIYVSGHVSKTASNEANKMINSSSVTALSGDKTWQIAHLAAPTILSSRPFLCGAKGVFTFHTVISATALGSFSAKALSIL